MWQALTPTRIYLNDLRDIWEIVARASEQVSAQTDRAAGLSDVTSLLDHVREEPPREVIIIGARGGRPCLRVRLGSNEASVWYQNDLAAFGALTLIQQVIWRHARNRGLETVSIPWLTGAWLLILIIPVARLLEAGPAAYIGAVVIAVAGAILGERTRKTRFTIFVPADEPHRRGGDGSSGSYGGTGALRPGRSSSASLLKPSGSASWSLSCQCCNAISEGQGATHDQTAFRPGPVGRQATSATIPGGSGPREGT